MSVIGRRPHRGRIVLSCLLACITGFIAWLAEPWSSLRYLEKVRAVLDDENANRQLAHEVDLALASLGTLNWMGIDLHDASHQVLPRLGRMATATAADALPPLPAHVSIIDGGRLKARWLWLFVADPAPGTTTWRVWEGGELHRLSETVFVSGLSPLCKPPAWVGASTSREKDGREKAGRSGQP